MTPKLLTLAKVCSVLMNIRDVSWHLSKRGSELEKRCTSSFIGKNGAQKNKAWFWQRYKNQSLDQLLTGEMSFAAVRMQCSDSCFLILSSRLRLSFLMASKIKFAWGSSSLVLIYLSSSSLSIGTSKSCCNTSGLVAI